MPGRRSATDPLRRWRHRCANAAAPCGATMADGWIARHHVPVSSIHPRRPRSATTGRSAGPHRSRALALRRAGRSSCSSPKTGSLSSCIPQVVAPGSVARTSESLRVDPVCSIRTNDPWCRGHGARVACSIWSGQREVSEPQLACRPEPVGVMQPGPGPNGDQPRDLRAAGARAARSVRNPPAPPFRTTRPCALLHDDKNAPAAPSGV